MKCGAIRGIIGGKIPFDPNIIKLKKVAKGCLFFLFYDRMIKLHF